MSNAPTRLAWLSDIHLNFVEMPDRALFYAQVRDAQADAILLSGDIGEADTLAPLLLEMAAELERPIHFVLGNHDFYRAGIAMVRELAVELGSRNRHLLYTPTAGVVRLSDRTALVGHDGWGDCGFGDPIRSDVQLNDNWLIEELAGLADQDRHDVLKALGEECARHLERWLPIALDQYEQVVVLTHVPPFREACLYRGSIANDDWLPYFVCRAGGEILRQAALAYPHRKILVLCGHTHTSATASIEPNLQVWTAPAQYGRPTVERLLTMP